MRSFHWRDLGKGPYFLVTTMWLYTTRAWSFTPFACPPPPFPIFIFLTGYFWHFGKIQNICSSSSAGNNGFQTFATFWKGQPIETKKNSQALFLSSVTVELILKVISIQFMFLFLCRCFCFFAGLLGWYYFLFGWIVFTSWLDCFLLNLFLFGWVVFASWLGFFRC